MSSRLKKTTAEAIDAGYMRRALQLARGGYGFVSPNPMVGAVIVAGGRIIGEGFHRRWGAPHAEVNAVASVSRDDEYLLPDSTIYVTLEPCSHYGKTPPCAELLIRKGIKRVVIGCLDPFKEVSGRGVRMLREASREVVTGVLENECRALNKRFMTAHTLRRPFITLKWAETADGFIGAVEEGRQKPVAISDSLGRVLVHRLRAASDAILVGGNTLRSDNPSLDVRYWPGRDPLRVLLSHDAAPLQGYKFFRDDNYVVLHDVDDDDSLRAAVARLYSERGVSSLLVEGGAKVLESFIRAGLWDEIRRERSAATLGSGTPAPALPSEARKIGVERLRDSLVEHYVPNCHNC